MKPGKAIHPGEILLEEFLKPLSKSQRTFAREIGWTTAKTNEIITAKRGITAESALDLAKHLKTGPEVWMNLQSYWDLEQARQKRKVA